jgi:hypothetical protein
LPVSFGSAFDLVKRQSLQRFTILNWA